MKICGGIYPGENRIFSVKGCESSDENEAKIAFGFC
jgi:hypothetical protein